MDPQGHRRLACVARVVLFVTACLLLGLSGTAGAASDPLKPVREHGRGHWFRPTCKLPVRGAAGCNALVVTNAAGAPLVRKDTPAAGALGPAQLAQAYGLPAAAPAGATIAIVDAYDDPNIEADLATYSSFYGLPACTTANGCFRKLDQRGGTSYPAKSTSWGQEISLDVEIAHGICQTCRIVLVEAASSSYTDLGTAVNQAVAQGAGVISNSYGGAEFANELQYDQYYNHPGVVVVASTGDSGYGSQYPAAAPGVVAVGGTKLTLAAGGGYGSETAWAKGGSGCSPYEARPSWQPPTPACAQRIIADVSADADPNSGAAIYDSYGGYGWLQIGGTSLSAPLVAAVYALAGNSSTPTAPYASPGALHDVTSGSNGSCTQALLCVAGPGYDGPTGLGTPNGLAAFGAAPVSADFSLSVSPPGQSMTQGGSTSFTVTLSPNATFGSAAATISAVSTPADVTITGCADPLTAAAPSCTLNVATSDASAATSHSLAITASGPGLPNHTSTAALILVAPLAPDYSLALSPLSQSVTQGGQADYLVTLTPNATFGNGASVAVAGASDPADVAFSGCAAPLTAVAPTCTLSVATTTASAAVGHTLTVTGAGSSGLPSHAATATLGVTVPLPADYALALTPASQSVTQGQAASYTVTLTPNASFGAGDSVAIGTASVPAEVAATGCSTPLTLAAPSCTLTVPTATATLVSHALTVTGTGSAGLPVHTAAASLTVTAAAVGDFTIALSPTSRVVFTPALITYTVTITRINGFTAPVALTVGGLPGSFTASVPAPVTGTTATFTITAPKTAFSTVHVTVTGTSGSLAHTATATMGVI